MKPHYATEFSAGADLKANETVTIEPGHFVCVATGYVPTDDDFAECCAFFLFARSSLGIKKGLILGNGVGLIDHDYRDEIKVILHNVTGEPVTVEKGERIAQLMPVDFAAIGNVASWGVGVDLRQGGMGSTGGYAQAHKAGVYEA